MGDDSTAPTNRTKTPEETGPAGAKLSRQGGKPSQQYTGLDDSLEGAQIDDLQKASSPLKMTLTARGDRPAMVVRRADTDRSVALDQTDNQSIYNSCPENVRKTEAKLFLEKLGMVRFAEVLFRQGYDDLEQLLDITDETLKQLEIPVGFRIKFNKSRAEFKASPKKIELELRMTSKDTSAIRATSSYHELTMEEAESEGVSVQKRPKMAHTMATSTEETPEPKNGLKEVRNATSEAACSNVSTKTTPARCPTMYCYNCFQQVSVPHRSPLASHACFCSAKCLKFFTLDRSIVCLRESCAKVALKIAAAHSTQGWCCSEECAKLLDVSSQTNLVLAMPKASEIQCLPAKSDQNMVETTPYPSRLEIPQQVAAVEAQSRPSEQKTIRDSEQGFVAIPSNKSLEEASKVVQDAQEIDLDFDF